MLKLNRPNAPKLHVQPMCTSTPSPPPEQLPTQTDYASMSSTPKASRSTITNLTVNPDKWAFYPRIEHSTLAHCTFTNLGELSKIERSVLREVKLHSSGSHFNIERSTISGGTLSDVYVIERSELTGCDVGKRTKIERSKCTKSIVSNNTTIERSKLSHCLVADSSKIERSELVDCEIVSCKLSRTKMQGMLLRNGIWDRNDLVGRINSREEVVCRPLGSEGEPSTPHSVTLTPATPATPAEGVEWPLYGGNVEQMRAYEGPRVATPPPPYDDVAEGPELRDEKSREGPVAESSREGRIR